MQIYGIAMSKARHREEIAYFSEQIQFTLHDETKAHLNFCDYIETDYESLQDSALPPTADHYLKHMMYHAQTGTLGETLSALLPCPWTYTEIAHELIRNYQPTEQHPFYKWITYYATTEAATEEMKKRLDTFADQASLEEKTRMKEAFRKSCQLELGFWEMAFTCERWPGKEKVERI